MKIDPVDHPEPTSEASLDYAATGQPEATTAEQAQGRESVDSNTQARFAFGMQNGEKRVEGNELGRWLILGNVKPRDAALVLCLHDPIFNCGKTPTLFVTELKARDFEWLLKAFEDVAETEKRTSNVRARTLLDWRDMARDQKLKYHPWFDQHEQATVLIEEVGTAANPGAPANSESPATAAMVTNLYTDNSESTKTEPPHAEPRQQQRVQEKAILDAIKGLGYSATALPKPPPGKSGVKKRIREQVRMGGSVFDKAWERLRAGNEIKDAP